MSKLDLPELITLTNERSATATINRAFELIEQQVESLLSRDGETPNQMEADLDMNSFRILNTGAPRTDSDLVRLGDLASILSGDGEIEVTSTSATLTTLLDSGDYFTATNVEGALQEIGQNLANLTASEIAIVDTAGNFSSNDVEGALAELYTEVQGASGTIPSGTAIGEYIQVTDVDGEGSPGFEIDNAGNQLLILTAGTAADDVASIYLKRVADYTGGVGDTSNAGLRIDLQADAGGDTWEFPIVTLLDNYRTSSDSGPSGGAYLVSNKRSSGATFGATVELFDYTTNPTQQAGGMLITLSANGNDDNEQRTILTLTGDRRNASDTRPVIYQGIYIRPENDVIGNAKFIYGMRMRGEVDYPIVFDNIQGKSLIIAEQNTAEYGVDLGSANFTYGAFRMGTGQNFVFDTFGVVKMRYSSVNRAIEFYRGSSRKGWIDMSGVAPDRQL